MRFFTSDLGLVEFLVCSGHRWKCWRSIPVETFGFAKSAELQKDIDTYISKSAAALRRDVSGRRTGRDSEAVIKTPEQLLTALTSA